MLSTLGRYFSQNGEDFVLAEFFKKKKSGFFVDVGAFDGVHLSNSYCFELLGWNGICVEPQREYFELCSKNRPKTKCIHAACVEEVSSAEIMLHVDQTGLFSGANLSVEQKNITDHYDSLGKDFEGCRQETVPARTLGHILEEHASESVSGIDFLSIDVEGMEIEVLNGLDLKKFRPRVLILEAVTDEERSAAQDYLGSKGYQVGRRLGPNLFFVTNDHDAQAIREIEVTCVLEKQIHPRGEDYTQVDYLDGKIIYQERNGWSLMRNYDHCENALRMREGQVEKMKENISNFQSEIEKLRDQRERIRTQRETEIEKLRDQRETIRTQREALRQEIEALRQEIEALRNRTKLEKLKDVFGLSN